VATAGLLMWYFEFEKERMQRKRIADSTKGVGRPKVGGDFELIDQYGKRFTSDDMSGRYALVCAASFYLILCHIETQR
jgi:protein SCO1